MHYVDVGLAELQPNVDSLIPRPHDTLFELLGSEDLTADEFFARANDVLNSLAGDIVPIINASALRKARQHAQAICGTGYNLPCTTAHMRRILSHHRRTI